jgi:hypothetical protein
MEKSNKILEQGVHGYLPENLNKLFYIGDQDGIYFREGIYRSKSSFLNCVMQSLSDENILYHTFHEAPWGCYPINTGVKIVNKKAIKYEEEMWNLRNTSPWNEFPWEQKTLYEYIFPRLNKEEYRIHDPYILNCIIKAYPDKIHNALFLHMCAMTRDERDEYIKNI